MNDVLRDDLIYVISAEEVLWGALLLAITIALHGLGMVFTLRASRVLKQWVQRRRSHAFVFGVCILVVAAWMIILVDFVEISVWAWFYVWRGALPSASVAFYYALVNYTTLDSGYLPQRWRLLEGMLAMAGLFTLAWSTGVLFTLAQQFQDQVLGARKSQAPTTSRQPEDVDIEVRVDSSTTVGRTVR
jgi:hypothetical protein